MGMTSSVNTQRTQVEWLVWLPIVAGLAAMYVPSFIDLFRTLWSTDEQAHGPIVFGIACWLAYRKWPLMWRESQYEASSIFGWAVILLGLGLYIVGHSQEIVSFEIGSLIWVLAGTLLLTRGSAAFKVQWFALFFMLFMIPLPSSVVDAVTMPMKMAVSYVAEHVLFWVGYPIARTGVILQIGQYKLLVADACAGLHTLFTLEALGLLYLNIVRHDSLKRNITLAIFIVPISFAANVIRVIALTLITYHFGDEAGQGFLHSFAGMVLFLVALLLIFSLDSVLQLFFGGSSGSNFKATEQHASSNTSTDLPASNLGFIRQTISIGTAMLIAGVLSSALQPKPIPPSEHPQLETLIPRDFGMWTVDRSIIPILPSPDQKQQVDETYDQMVNRTYVNSSGKRIMVSIAYGSRQDQRLKAHRQEVCYAAQGFQIRNIRTRTVTVAGVPIEVTQMFAVANQREEPVTYWFTVGNQVVRSHFERLVAQLSYGLSGTIPDGVLVRVSSINSNEEAAYREQLEFISELLMTLPQESRSRFIGPL